MAISPDVKNNQPGVENENKEVDEKVLDQGMEEIGLAEIEAAIEAALGETSKAEKMFEGDLSEAEGLGIDTSQEKAEIIDAKEKFTAGMDQISGEINSETEQVLKVEDFESGEVTAEDIKSVLGKENVGIQGVEEPVDRVAEVKVANQEAINNMQSDLEAVPVDRVAEAQAANQEAISNMQSDVEAVPVDKVAEAQVARQEVINNMQSDVEAVPVDKVAEAQAARQEVINNMQSDEEAEASKVEAISNQEQSVNKYDKETQARIDELNDIIKSAEDELRRTEGMVASKESERAKKVLQERISYLKGYIEDNRKKLKEVMEGPNIAQDIAPERPAITDKTDKEELPDLNMNMLDYESNDAEATSVDRVAEMQKENQEVINNTLSDLEAVETTEENKGVALEGMVKEFNDNYEDDVEEIASNDEIAESINNLTEDEVLKMMDEEVGDEEILNIEDFEVGEGLSAFDTQEELRNVLGEEGVGIVEENKKNVEAIQTELKELPENRRKSVLENVANLGYMTTEMSNKVGKNIMGFFSNALENTDSDERGVVSKFFNKFSESFAKAEETAKNKREMIDKGVFLTGAGIAQGAGNIARIARVIADCSPVGLSPFRHMTATAAFAGKSFGVAKETRFDNESVIEKTRVGTVDESGQVSEEDMARAQEEAWTLYEEAKASSKDGEVTKEGLDKSYAENLPQDLVNRLDRGNFTGTGFLKNALEKDSKREVNRIVKKLEKVTNNDKLSVEQKAKKKEQIMMRYGDALKDMDRMIADQGTVDGVAYATRGIEKFSKAMSFALILDSAFQAYEKISDTLSNATENVDDIHVPEGLAQNDPNLEEKLNNMNMPTEDDLLSDIGKQIDNMEAPVNPTIEVKDGDNLVFISRKILNDSHTPQAVKQSFIDQYLGAGNDVTPENITKAINKMSIRDDVQDKIFAGNKVTIGPDGRIIPIKGDSDFAPSVFDKSTDVASESEVDETVAEPGQVEVTHESHIEALKKEVAAMEKLEEAEEVGVKAKIDEKISEVYGTQAYEWDQMQNRSALDILQGKFGESIGDADMVEGIHNRELQEYGQDLAKESGVMPKTGELYKDYIQRANEEIAIREKIGTDKYAELVMARDEVAYSDTIDSQGIDKLDNGEISKSDQIKLAKLFENHNVAEGGLLQAYNLSKATGVEITPKLLETWQAMPKEFNGPDAANYLKVFSGTPAQRLDGVRGLFTKAIDSVVERNDGVLEIVVKGAEDKKILMDGSNIGVDGTLRDNFGIKGMFNPKPKLGLVPESIRKVQEFVGIPSTDIAEDIPQYDKPPIMTNTEDISHEDISVTEAPVKQSISPEPIPVDDNLHEVDQSISPEPTPVDDVNEEDIPIKEDEPVSRENTLVNDRQVEADASQETTADSKQQEMEEGIENEHVNITPEQQHEMFNNLKDNINDPKKVNKPMLDMFRGGFGTSYGFSQEDSDELKRLATEEWAKRYPEE